MNREQFKAELKRRRALILTELQPPFLYSLALMSPIEPVKNMEKELLFMKDDNNND
jgi:hypothetical protein